MFHRTTGKLVTIALKYTRNSKIKLAEISPGRSNFHIVCPPILDRRKTPVVASMDTS